MAESPEVAPEGVDFLTCPRCNHKLGPMESHEEVAGVRTHRLQVCFDNLKGDYDKIKPPEPEPKQAKPSESKGFDIDDDEEDKESGSKTKKK